jgi:hypothetical protein
MADPPPNSSEMKLLPGTTDPDALSLPAAGAPQRQLSELPKDELDCLAEEYGLDPTQFKSRQHLVAAIHARRQLIASMDRQAMLDVIKWGRRPVSINATAEQLAREIARIKSMRFAGLSARGLLALARLRGLEIKGDETIPTLIHKLKKQEGFFSRLNRKRRAALGAIVSNIIGESDSAGDYQFLPAPGSAEPPRGGTIKEQIEDAGLFGGIAGRLKKSADQYLNQKLDEIEARIDRKLDEIDRRLAEWRDKEIANRIRILKITLWASVIVGAFSLAYSYVKVYIIDAPEPQTPARDIRSSSANPPAPPSPPSSPGR